MTDPGREREGGKLTTPDSEPGQAARRQGESGRSTTEGTNRDFDESGESANQGHGHPREERAQ
jgi:hypothetical protein